MVDDDWVGAPLWRLFGLPSHSISSRDLSGSVARSQSQRYLALSLQSARGILPLATYVSTMPLQNPPPSDNIIFFAEMDGQGALGGATFGFSRSFDLRLKSGL